MDQKTVFEASPWGAIASLTIPALVSILVMMLYNMADMYFVGWLNDLSQTAAVSLAMPVFSILMAISQMIGNGGCTKIAQALGQKDEATVRSLSALCFYASIGFGIFFLVLCFAFQKPLLSFLGTSAETYKYTRQYLLILAAGAPLILLNHTLGGMLRGEGLVKVGLIGSMISTIANIALDPVFILTLKLGVSGAAIATVLGNVIAVVYYLIYRARHRDSCILELSPRYAKDLGLLLGILSLGLPNAISSLLSGLAGTFSNRILAGYGTSAIAAMSAAGKSVLIVTMVQMGLCMGVQPLLAYLYGGKEWKRLRGIVTRLLGLTLALGTGLTLLLLFGRTAVIELFIHDAEAVSLASDLSVWILAMGPFVGIYYLASNFLQACGNAAGASLASALRQGLVLIPFLYILSSFFGLTGLAAAYTVADGLSILVTAVLAISYYKKKTSGAPNFSEHRKPFREQPTKLASAQPSSYL